MQLSKIGSKNTYHKCIKQLHLANYIIYHPSISKFQPVHISVIRLDIKKDSGPLQQLDLFQAASPPPAEATEQSEGWERSSLGGGWCIKSDTHTVPNLTATSTDNDTDTVPNMGQYIKPNNKQRETPTHQIFKKNEKIQNAINDFGGVSKSVHTTGGIPSSEGLGVGIPDLQQVKTYFTENNHPPTEAKKFYNHYKALGWKIQGVTPIEDWKALVEKWMANAEKWNNTSSSVIASKTKQSQQPELGYLYESYLEEKKIYHHITTNHFDQLKIEITDKELQQAWQQRINQVTGTNQHSVIELWKAYLTNNPDHPLIQKDQPNLLALAKRIAVLNHFYSLKQTGCTALPP